MQVVGAKRKHKADSDLHAGQSVVLADGRYIVSFGASAGAMATLSFVEPIKALKVEPKIIETEKETEEQDEC